MREAAVKAIYSYWRAIAAGEPVPARTAIDPRALKSHLADLFILERLDRAVFSFRLAGTRVCARYGRELRDRDFIRLWSGEQQGEILASLNRCLQKPEPLVLKGTAATLDAANVDFQILLLPLADANGQVNRILGAMITADDIALKQGATLISQTVEAVVTPSLGSAAPQTTAAFIRARPTHVSFLRVVDGSKDCAPDRLAVNAA
jgi:hypothetical protein